MLSKTPALLAATAFLLFSACGSEQNGLPPAQVPPPVNAPATSLTAPVATPSDGSVKLNPAHGEPGHVCELPVGAPLDGSGAAAAPAATTPTVVPPPPAVTLPPAGASDGITLPAGTPNPAHGQPGHRCDVNVGDPLP